MSFLAGFFYGIIPVLKTIFGLINLLIIGRAIISWVNADPSNPIVQFLHQTTEPLLRPFRRLLPPMAVDISPILVILTLIFLEHFLVWCLVELVNILKG